MTHFGVQGACHELSQIRTFHWFMGWNQSTSLRGCIAEIIFCVSIVSGSGSWMIYQEVWVSQLSSQIISSNSDWDTCSQRCLSLNTIPTDSQAFCFWRIYRRLEGLSPTNTAVSWGWALSFLIDSCNSWLYFAANVFPDSIIVSVRNTTLLYEAFFYCKFIFSLILDVLYCSYVYL